MSTGYSNAIWNPLEVVRGKALVGTGLFVAIEAIVGQIVRKVMSVPTNWSDSAETHLYSVPMLGQLNFGEAYTPYLTKKEGKVEVVTEGMEGLKQVIAALAGYTTMKIRQDGLKLPSYMNKDVFYLIIGKMVSRVLKQYMMSSLPKDFQVSLSVINALANRQLRIINATKREEKDY